ncbi:23760_t:CDS:1, partial [Gigaspora rosea]
LGWHAELQQTLIDDFGQLLDDQSEAPRLTQMAFYSFCLFSRFTEFSLILWRGKLFQEFIVNAWAATEQNRLRYLHMNQSILRADSYRGLAEA